MLNTALHTATRAAKPRRANLIGRVFDTWRQRRALSDLDPHLLRDIGLSEYSAQAESRRPLWDVPHHWR